MPYETPTATAFKARYTEFDPVSDARVDVFISEALSSVDNSWVETDYQPAIMALTAHKLVLEGEPQRSSDPSALVDVNNLGRKIKTRKVGDVSTEFEGTEMSASANDKGSSFTLGLSKTSYGQRYLQLLKLNAAGMRVV